MKRLMLLAALIPTLATAAEPMTGPEFERMTTGKTFAYANEGVAYGAEEYLDNRRVRWTFLDGECQEGKWYEAGEQICFVYDNIETPQCWRFFDEGGRLTAQFSGQSPATELFETARMNEPLHCLGPEVGV